VGAPGYSINPTYFSLVDLYKERSKIL